MEGHAHSPMYGNVTASVYKRCNQSQYSTTGPRSTIVCRGLMDLVGTNDREARNDARELAAGPCSPGAPPRVVRHPLKVTLFFDPIQSTSQSRHVKSNSWNTSPEREASPSRHKTCLCRTLHRDRTAAQPLSVRKAHHRSRAHPPRAARRSLPAAPPDRTVNDFSTRQRTATSVQPQSALANASDKRRNQP
eukprot:3432014-Rhodomonas_salina.1